MEAGRHLRMLKWGRDMEMGNGPWTTMAVRKGEKVNCKHFRIPDFHPIQQERSKSYLHDNTLPGDQSVQGGFTLHLPCSHLFSFTVHGNLAYYFPSRKLFRKLALASPPPFQFNHQGTLQRKAASMSRHLLVRQKELPLTTVSLT